MLIIIIFSHEQHTSFDSVFHTKINNEYNRSSMVWQILKFAAFPIKTFSLKHGLKDKSAALFELLRSI